MIRGYVPKSNNTRTIDNPTRYFKVLAISEFNGKVYPMVAISETHVCLVTEKGQIRFELDEAEEMVDYLLVKNDPVHHPSHYTDGKIEVIDFIEDKQLGYHLGNCIKYIARAGKKDASKTIQDLEKAAWYLNRKIEQLKEGQNG